MKNGAAYTHEFDGRILVLEDLCTGAQKSLTNDMENVLLDMAIQYELNLHEITIIYRDTEGIYDQVIWNGKDRDVTFISLNQENLNLAKIKALQHAKETE